MVLSALTKSVCPLLGISLPLTTSRENRVLCRLQARVGLIPRTVTLLAITPHRLVVARQLAERFLK